MDRSLDDIVSERQRGGGRGRRGGGVGGGRGRRNDRNDYPRDGVRKVGTVDNRSDRSDAYCGCSGSHTSSLILMHLTLLRSLPHTAPKPVLTTFGSSMAEKYIIWNSHAHDIPAGRRPARAERRYSPEQVYDTASAKLRVENLHYELTEEDLEDLFTRIGRIQKLVLTYDRAGRSEGVAYVTYENAQDAKSAIREFDGANAKGQPIRLTAVPSGPSAGRSRNPFDSAVIPGRSLADRITVAGGGRSRSLSPVRRYAPDNVDRYVPGQRDSRSPPRRRERRDGGREGGRRPGARRERGDRGATRGPSERTARDGRPRKTQEELDAEMEDYWGSKEKENGGEEAAAAPAAQPQDDVDMIECSSVEAQVETLSNREILTENMAIWSTAPGNEPALRFSDCLIAGKQQFRDELWLGSRPAGRLLAIPNQRAKEESPYGGVRFVCARQIPGNKVAVAEMPLACC
ncbi:hypothetical protein BP5796_10453 [Coleophoma crateriformis]|uniref:RRM domain-containing protein n=1 Tax=Coleophoma crateriformis TaxID=565419 RepID=A0A3D8QQG2_9HELO|nr:hypothetical protein BP5796_10453 [Coleophoma crateriformis]